MYASDVLFIIKLGLISHIILVICYYFEHVTIYYFQVLRLLHILIYNLNVHKFYKHSLQALFSRVLLHETQNNVFDKSQDYCRETWTSWKLIEGNPWQKQSSLLQLRTPHQGTARTGTITNYYKNYFSTCPRGIGCFYT